MLSFKDKLLSRYRTWLCYYARSTKQLLCYAGFETNGEELHLSFPEAIQWFETAWNSYDELEEYYKKNHKNNKSDDDDDISYDDENKAFFDDDFKAILRMLTQKTGPNNRRISGYIKLKPVVPYHTNQVSESFDTQILKHLREGKIVIIDLSTGTEEIQKYYSEKICQTIFRDAMDRFVNLKHNNFIQIYFEEAHNLFPRYNDKDLTQIYTRIAKEGAKLNIGIVYLTQEVSSISSNILKNTQNMFIAHLNNDHELRELKAFYDFEDFIDGLKKFSHDTDIGFVRMKLLSNAFSLPVQIDRFGKNA